MHHRITAIVLLLFTAPAAAQTITTAIQAGNPVGAIGNVTNILDLDVNDSGQWVVEVRTDNPDPTLTDAIITNDGPVLALGDPVTVPAGSNIIAFGPSRIDDRGRRVHLHTLSGLGGPSGNPALFVDDAFVFATGDPATAVGFAPGATWSSLLKIWVNGANQVLVTGRVDVPGAPPTVESALVLLTIDDSGQITGESIVWKTGDAIGTDVIADIGFASSQGALNDLGQTLCYVDFIQAFQDDALVTDTGLVIQEGDASAVVGTTIETLNNRPLDMNNAGDFAYRANVTGTTNDDEIIVKNNSVLIARENSGFPDIAPFVFTSFGTGSPVLVDELGNVLFYGNWSGPLDTDTGIFLNDELLIQEGVSTVDGVPIDTFAFFSDAFAMSDNGRWILFEATLMGGIEGAFLYDRFASPDSFCDANGCTPCPCGNDAPTGVHGGCTNSSGRSALLWTAGDPSVSADTLRFELDGAKEDTYATLFSADSQVPIMGPCPVGSGILGNSDGLICIGGGMFQHGTRPTDHFGDVGETNSGWGGVDDPLGGIAAQAGFVAGQTRHFQAVYRESSGKACGNNRNSSNGVSITFAP